MEQSGQTIRRQLDQAREARDVVKVLCLNDKLNQVDVAVRSTRDRVASLNNAVDRNDSERSHHEFTVIQVLRDRVRALSQEASQCIGEETGFIDEPKVSVQIDPAIPKDETSSPIPDNPVIVTPPTTLSAER
jgi:choline kinase